MLLVFSNLSDGLFQHRVLLFKLLVRFYQLCVFLFQRNVRRCALLLQLLGWWLWGVWGRGVCSHSTCGRYRPTSTTIHSRLMRAGRKREGGAWPATSKRSTRQEFQRKDRTSNPALPDPTCRLAVNRFHSFYHDVITVDVYKGGTLNNDEMDSRQKAILGAWPL